MDEQTTGPATAAETAPATGSRETSSQDTRSTLLRDSEPMASRSFTQDQVNDLMKRRLERSRQRFCSRYGVGDLAGLDALVGKAQVYDSLKGDYDKIKAENSALNERIAFMGNNVNPSKYDDVRAYFKGKSIAFSEGQLAEELKTHPEWLNVPGQADKPVTTIRSLGVEAAGVPQADERAIASKYFGVKL